MTLPDGTDLRLEPHLLQEDLARDARSIDQANARLGAATKELEGYQPVKEGERPEFGLALRWEVVLDECLLEVQAAMEEAAGSEDNKLPAAMKSWPAKVIDAKTRQAAKDREPDLWSRLCDLRTEVKALEKWIKGKERAASIRQTLLTSQTKGPGAHHDPR